jgi:hypothetical protein
MQHAVDGLTGNAQPIPDGLEGQSFCPEFSNEPSKLLIA